jgi:hypothetical protein
VVDVFLCHFQAGGTAHENIGCLYDPLRHRFDGPSLAESSEMRSARRSTALISCWVNANENFGETGIGLLFHEGG